MVWTKIFKKTVFAAVLSGGFLLLGGATTARADNMKSCHKNVDKWEDRLDHDIHRYGEYSKQVKHDRHEMDEARESCERKFGNHWRNHNDFDRDHDGDRR